MARNTKLLKICKSYLPWFATCFLIFEMLGCHQPVAETGPSYADLVVTYNAELAALDRLESRREKVAAEFAAAMQPSADESGALSQLEGILDAAKELQSDSKIDPSTVDPNALLDQLTERNSEATDLAGELLKGLAGDDQPDGGDARVSSESDVDQKADLAAIRAKFEPQLAELDEEIAAQKVRVERAKAARDTAEATAE